MSLGVALGVVPGGTRTRRAEGGPVVGAERGRGVACLAGALMGMRGGGVHERAQARAVLGTVEQRALRGAVVAGHATAVVRDDHGVVCHARGSTSSRCRWPPVVPCRPRRITWCAAGRPAGGEGGVGGVSRIGSTVVGIRRGGWFGWWLRTCVRR